MAITSKYSSQTGAAPQGVGINDNRRIYNFGERVAELAPQQSPFFVYLNKVGRKPTDDPVFKFLEQRHQWQRRNFLLESAITAFSPSAENTIANFTMKLMCKYDSSGAVTTNGQSCGFIIGAGDSVGQMINVVGTWDKDGSGDGAAKSVIVGLRIVSGVSDTAVSDGDSYTNVTVQAVSIDGNLIASVDSAGVANHPTAGTLGFADGALGQVVGSAHPEGGKAPDGWEDSLFDREGYTQIFKTGMKLFSGTAMATRYRGYADEFKRIWKEKLMEHKMDLEHAMLFGVGGSDESSAGPIRKTHGILPYTMQHGTTMDFDYSDSTYDTFLDSMETFFAPESGNSGDKLVLASRKVIGWFNKLGANTFLGNTVGSSQYKMDVQNIKGAFGHEVTKVNTIFGNLHFVQEPLLRGPWEDYAVAVDTKNVAYRPLVGNGQNRDTHIMTNIQGNDEDGRRDLITTEAGLEIQLPETHAVMKWVD